MSFEEVLADLEGPSEIPVGPTGRRKSLFESPLIRNTVQDKGNNNKTNKFILQPSKNVLVEDVEEEEEEEDVEAGGRNTRPTTGTGEDYSLPASARSSKSGDTGDGHNKVGHKNVRKNSDGAPLEDQLTNAKLQQLEEIFSEADEDGGGGLDMEEFRKAMRTQLGNNITDAELDKIFMKVDTNCDGTVDWDEYLTYMLLECKGQDTMSIQARQPFPKYVTTVKSPHRDSIVCILFISTVRLESDTSREGLYGRYMTVGQDGIVCLWTTSMNFLATHKIVSEGKSIWVTDAVYLCGVQAVAVSSTSREILLYDVSANRFQLTRKITNLHSCALALHFWNNNGLHKLQFGEGKTVRAILVWGDSNGGLATIFFHSDPYNSPLCGKFEQKNNRKRIAFQEMVLDRIPGMSATYRPQLHKDLIRQVMFCPQLSSTISCCKDSETAMFVGGIGSKLSNSFFEVTKGIDTFDYAPSLNVIVTGGYDGLVRVWNPYVPAKPVIRLDGHQFPVLHLRIDTVLENVVSISEIKEIRVHDLTTQTCIQTIYKKMIHGLGPRHVTAFFLNQGRQNLVFATNVVAILEPKEEERASAELISHNKPISHALYNPLFEQVVSVGTDSLVCVWSITTGEKVMQFKAHQMRRNGEMRDVEVTAMVFDPTFRRLITAAKNGEVRIWNFNNGACLRILPKFDNLEVTSLACPNHNIITAGWNRRVTKYVDSVDDDSVRWLKLYHQDDILSVSHYNGSVLASSSYDGNILVWSLATGRLLFCLNGEKSDRQIRAATYFETEMIKVDCGLNLAGGKSATDDVLPEGGKGEKKGYSSQTGQKPPSVKKCQENSAHSIQKLLFLEARENDANTAILLAASSDGHIQAWSLQHKSGLLGRFPVGHLKETSVVAMVTDEENFVLITGDSRGYVKVFDISNYCISMWEENESDEVYISERDNWHKKFHFYSWSQNIRDILNSDTRSWIKDYYKEGERRPPLLNSYRAHLQSITSVDIVQMSASSMIMTASQDKSIRLWKIDGQFVGIFGQTDLWDSRLTLPHRHKVMEVKSKGVYRHRKVLMPPDIRRVGSAATLMVLNGGRRPAWKLCSNVIKWVFKSIQHKSQETLDRNQDNIVPKVSSIKVLSNAEEKTHSIFGYSTMRLTRHHPLPCIPPLRFNGITEVVSVYGSLRYHQLDDVVEPVLPEEVKLILSKRKAQKFLTEANLIHKRIRGLKAFRGSCSQFRLGNKKMSISRADSVPLENCDQNSNTATKKEAEASPSNGVRVQSNGSDGSDDAVRQDSNTASIKLTAISEI